MFFVLLTFVLVFSVFHVLYGNNPPKSIYIISVILLILVGGFRYFVGIDYEAYKLMYELDNDSSNYLYYVEPGWSVIYNIIHFVKGTYILWFLVINAITVILMIYGIRRQSPFIFLSMIFYVGSFLYTESFNAMRQCVAMAIVFVGTPLIFQRKEWYYMLLIALAMCFHYSAGIALVFFLLKKKYNFTLMLSVLLFSALFGDYLLNNYLIPLTESFGAFFSSALDTRKSYVLDATEHDVMLNSGLKKLVYNVLALIMLVFAKKWDGQKLFYLNCFVLSIMIYNVFRGFLEYLRLYQYFFMYGLILYPIVVKNVKDNMGKWIAFMLLFIPILIFVLKDNFDVIYQTRFGLFE